jgi:chromodomain-helicase-DNA-binding protein 7
MVMVMMMMKVTLTSMQKRFYRAIYEKNTEFLFKGLKASNQPSLMNIMMELRKCCNHPYLVKGVEDRVLSELSDEEKLDDNVIFRKLIETSGKFVLLDKLLPRLYSQGHKVLVFSQMVRVLNLLEDFMRFKGYIYERLDGSTKSTDRKEAVDRFCKPSMDRFIMLMSTKAGGLGTYVTTLPLITSHIYTTNRDNYLISSYIASTFHEFTLRSHHIIPHTSHHITQA